MDDNGVLGGSVPCQSQSQTVPNEPSPRTLSGVYDLVEPVPNEYLSSSERRALTALRRADDEPVILDVHRGDSDNINRLLWLLVVVLWLTRRQSDIVGRLIGMLHAGRRGEHDTGSIARARRRRQRRQKDKQGSQLGGHGRHEAEPEQNRCSATSEYAKVFDHS